jgi:hypothetical protein
MPEQTEEEFIATARKRFQAAADDEKPLREDALIDLKFVAGDQWDPKLKKQREDAGRPAMTFPRCHTFVQQVSNEARQNKPQIKFAPKEDGDEDTAEVYEGMARAIQYSSDAQIAYETAVEYSAGGSFGYYRFITELDDDGDLVLKIVPVFDPFAVFGILIPSCFRRRPRYGFVVEDIPKDEYKELYPDSEIVALGWEDAEKKAEGWIGTETVRTAEYWYVEGGVSNPSKAVVKSCKMSGLEKLPRIDGKEKDAIWPGYCIPIIPVLGKQMIVDGKPKLFSVVRHQQGAQKMINVTKSRIAETLMSAPITPFMVQAGQIQGFEAKWNTLNTQVYPYLEYNAIDNNGKPAGPPQRQTFEAPIQALSEFAAQEIDDMKATAGIYDASLGAKSNVVSGLAKQQDTQQSNITNMHFMDNLERAFKEGGLVMADVIPKVYDTARMIAILGIDEAPKVVKINQPYDDNGKQKHYKVGGEGAGKYHVVVTMGRAFSTKRQETFDMMTQLAHNSPNSFPMFADIMFKNSDIAGSDQLAERFYKMLPPQLHDDDENDPEAKAQALQGQLAQATQHLQAINAYAQQLEKEKEGKVVEQQGKAQIAQMEIASKESIIKMQEATKIAVAQINASKDANEAIADRELEQFRILHQSSHEAATQAQDHKHEQKTLHDQAIIASAQAEQKGAIDSAQAEQGHQQTLEQQQAAADLQPPEDNSGQ